MQRQCRGKNSTIPPWLQALQLPCRDRDSSSLHGSHLCFWIFIWTMVQDGPCCVKGGGTHPKIRNIAKQENSMKREALILHLPSFEGMQRLFGTWFSPSPDGPGAEEPHCPRVSQGRHLSRRVMGPELLPLNCVSSQSHFRRVLFHCCLPDNVTESFNWA